jgi:cysteine desulfurase
MSAMKRIYLDYAATTPVDLRVRRAMEPYFSERFGNSGSVHSFGQEAIAAVDGARETIAHSIGAGFREIIFTGSATEANNLVLRGTIRKFWPEYFVEHGKRKRVSVMPHIVVSAIEHESILETARDIAKRGAVRVTFVPVRPDGIVNPDAIRAALKKETVLVSVMYANNEVGTVQPIREISHVIKKYKPSIQFHTDAVQAFQYLDCNVDTLGVDLMTLSSHKIYGPKGAGALYVRHETRDMRQGMKGMRQETRDRRQGTRDMRQGTWDKKQGNNLAMSHVPCPMSPIITGGGQEFGLRSGTENVPAIVGFAKAVELAVLLRTRETVRVTKLRNKMLYEIKKRVPEVLVNGSFADRVPNNLNLRVPGVLAEELLTALDLRGIAVSAGPACAARTAKPSHVLSAIGLSEAAARECVRITLGRSTTRADIDRFVKVFVQCIR